MVIHQGGRGSRKTYGILDAIIYLCLLNRDKNYLFSVVSETMPHVRRGSMRDFENLLHIYGLWPEVEHLKTLLTYKLAGNQIEFFGADSPDKVRGPRRDFLFLNEVNNIGFDAFDQLKGRTSQLTICDYNPVAEFYIHSEILPNPEAFNYSFTISTFKDNPYLPPGERDDIEAKRKLAETNPYWENWWRVYGLGEVGILQGCIFSAFQQVDAMPEGGRELYGLDFGFSNDPTALVRCVIKDNDLYIDELIYQTGLLNKDIVSLMKQNNVQQRISELYGDSAEPKTIQEIYLSGFNIKPSVKGTDSIKAGIEKIQSYNIKVTKRSIHLIKELRNYTWVRDKEGKATNKPVDAWNHAIDAIRYALTPLISKKQTAFVI